MELIKTVHELIKNVWGSLGKYDLILKVIDRNYFESEFSIKDIRKKGFEVKFQDPFQYDFNLSVSDQCGTVVNRTGI